MPGETLNAPAAVRSAPPVARTLPRHLLYSIFARIGGSGLDTDTFETLRASYRGGFLGKAIAYDNRQKEIPASLIRSLRWHPVRLISFLDRPYYYGAKKKYLDWITSREVATGRYDLFHSWSGDCLRSRPRIPGGKTLLPASRGRCRTFQTGEAPTEISRCFCRRSDQTQRHSTCAEGVAPAEPG